MYLVTLDIYHRIQQVSLFIKSLTVQWFHRFGGDPLNLIALQPQYCYFSINFTYLYSSHYFFVCVCFFVFQKCQPSAWFQQNTSNLTVNRFLSLLYLIRKYTLIFIFLGEFPNKLIILMQRNIKRKSISYTPLHVSFYLFIIFFCFVWEGWEI